MKPINEITNFEELKEASNQYAKFSRDISQNELEMNKEIDKIKSKYDVKNASNKAIVTAISTMIQRYITENKEELITEPKRSMELPLVTIGYRRSCEVSIPNAKIATILEAIKSQGRYECIDIRETVKKSVLSSWSNEALSEIGVLRKEKDTFYIEIKTEILNTRNL